MRLLNCKELGEELNRHATYVYAMKRAGFKFNYGNRTTLENALNWLKAHPEFRSTRYRIVNGQKRPLHLQAATADTVYAQAH